MATDADENDMLTYTLGWGDSSSNLSKTDITATGRSGQSVALEKSGLNNDTRYWFKVVVSDGIDEVTSGDGNEKTYCKGEYCSGGYYEYPKCTHCNGTGKITCSICKGTGSYGTETIICNVCDGSGKSNNVCGGTLDYDEGRYGTGGYCGGDGCVSNGKFRNIICILCGSDKGSNGSYYGYRFRCDKHYLLTWPTPSGTCSQKAKCVACEGSGEKIIPKTCTNCNGTKKVTCNRCRGDGHTSQAYNCIHGQVPNSPHYYCVSHGNNISQHHK